MSSRLLFMGTFIAIVLTVTDGVSARAESVEVISRAGETQYSNTSPMPGAIIAITPDGTPDGLGAAQINIPVAYTPIRNFLLNTLSAGNHMDQKYTSFQNTNGTGAIGATLTEGPRVYFSGNMLSHHLAENKAFGIQVETLRENEIYPGLSIGVQDVFQKEPGGMSPYLVVTKELAVGTKNLYGTAGYGGGRFQRRPFGGLSAPLGGWFNLACEYDGLQMNTGLTIRPGGKTGHITFLVGYNGVAGWVFSLGGLLRVK